MEKALTIYFADLAYLHEEDYIHPFPLNVGYVAAYLLKQHPETNIKIVKDPDKLLELAMRPDFANVNILAISNYEWNFNLNKTIVTLIKERNKNILVIGGGPNIDVMSEEETITCLERMDFIDIYVTGEGEYKFADTVNALLAHDMDPDAIFLDVPEGVLRLDRETEQLKKGGKTNIPCDYSDLPSPYLTGLMDEFFEDEHLVPMLETTRGCPYHCAYCFWGNATNAKLRKFPIKTVLAEIDYISKKCINPTKALYVTDGNFGIFKRDIAIAKRLLDNSNNYLYPRELYITFLKDLSEIIISIAKMLKHLSSISMSRQSLNKDVLKIIGRKNIDDALYTEYHSRLSQLGANTYCELIYPLPGETYDTFIKGFEKMTSTDMPILAYQLVMIKGSKLNSKKSRNQYDVKTKFRIIPRCAGVYGGVASLEYEEIVVSTNLFSFADNIEVRLTLFLYSIFKEEIFAPITLYLSEHNLNIVKFIRHIIANKGHLPASISEIYAEFTKAAKDELLEYSETTSTASVVMVKEIQTKGLALNIYYFCKLISSTSSIHEFHQYLTTALQDYFNTQNISVEQAELKEMLKFCFERIIRYEYTLSEKLVHCNYDFSSWINDKHEHKSNTSQLEKYKSSCDYVFYVDNSIENVTQSIKQHSSGIVDQIYKTKMSFYRSSKAYTYCIRQEQPHE